MTIAYYVLVPLNMCPVPLSSEIYSLVEPEPECDELIFRTIFLKRGISRGNLAEQKAGRQAFASIGSVGSGPLRG